MSQICIHFGDCTLCGHALELILKQIGDGISYSYVLEAFLLLGDRSTILPQKMIGTWAELRLSDSEALPTETVMKEYISMIPQEMFS